MIRDLIRIFTFSSGLLICFGLLLTVKAWEENRMLGLWVLGVGIAGVAGTLIWVKWIVRADASWPKEGSEKDDVP